METDTGSGDMGPATDEIPAWMGMLMYGMGWGLPPPMSRGEQAPTLIEGQVCRGGVRRQSARCC